MRELADAERIGRFLRELGNAATEDGACYLAGGATAVLRGWRGTTIDVDIELAPDSDALLRALPRLKNELRRGLIEPERTLRYAEIEPELYRFPAVDPAGFRRRVESAMA